MSNTPVSGWPYVFGVLGILFFLPRIMGADNPVTLSDGSVADLRWPGGVLLLLLWAWTLWIAYREGRTSDTPATKED